MTNKQIITLFKQHKPATPEQVQKIGFELLHIGSGGARIVYRVVSNKQRTGLVVKFDQCGGCQNQKEIFAMKHIRRDPQMKIFRVHVPPLYYESPDKRLIVTKYYETEVSNEPNHELDVFMSKMEQIGVGDLFYKNVRKDKRGRFVAIDLGYYRSAVNPEND